MKKVNIKDEKLIADVENVSLDPGDYHFWWLGQSGFLIKWKDIRILIDPYLSDSLTRKYKDTDKPHERMTERKVDPELLKNISIVTSSHNHTDHLDAETLLPILRNNPGIRMVIPEANRAFVAERLGTDPGFPVGLNEGQKVMIEGIEILGVPAKHNEVDRDEHGNCKYMGYVFSMGDIRVYHSGDTLWHQGIIDQVARLQVDVAILPINGNDPARRVAGNLNAKEAVEMGIALGAGTVIPCHYDMFYFNTADVAEFEKEAAAQGKHWGRLDIDGRQSFLR